MFIKTVGKSLKFKMSFKKYDHAEIYSIDKKDVSTGKQFIFRVRAKWILLRGIFRILSNS